MVTGVAAGMLLAAVTAQANLITGEIDMSGTVSLNGNSLATATSATFYAGTVTYDSGAYSRVNVGTPVNWASVLSWNPKNTPVTLWTFQSKLLTYTFTVGSVNVVSQSSSRLALSGTGVATITGLGSPFQKSLATWSLSIFRDPSSDTGYRFTFDDPLVPFVPQSVPDGGTTAGLLGLALAGLGFLYRKKFGTTGKTRHAA